MCRETPTPQSSPNRHISPPSPSNLPSSPQTFKYGPIPPPKSLPNSSNLQIMESLRLEKTSDRSQTPTPSHPRCPHLCYHISAFLPPPAITSPLFLSKVSSRPTCSSPPPAPLMEIPQLLPGSGGWRRDVLVPPPPKCHRCFTRDCRHEIPVHEGFQVGESHGSPPLPAKGLPAISNSLLES